MAATGACNAKALPTLLTSRPHALESLDGKEPRSAFIACPEPVYMTTQVKEWLPKDYPAQVRVRNTFIDTSAERSPSLESFYHERRVSTCPSSKVGQLRGLFQEEADGEPAIFLPGECGDWAPVAQGGSDQDCQSPDDAELPSAGSMGHLDGACKPCAFFHTVGCTNGQNCEFCHLCEAGERRRRRKEKLEGRRAAHKLRKGTRAV